MQELVTRQHIESGKVIPGVAFVMAKFLLARTIIEEMDKYASYRSMNDGRLVVVKCNDQEVVELSQTLEAHPRDREYGLHLATEDDVFNYHLTPKARVAVRAEFDPRPPTPSAEQRRATAVGFVTATEILGLSQYVGAMQPIHLPSEAVPQTFTQPE